MRGIDRIDVTMDDVEQGSEVLFPDSQPEQVENERNESSRRYVVLKGESSNADVIGMQRNQGETQSLSDIVAVNASGHKPIGSHIAPDSQSQNLSNRVLPYNDTNIATCDSVSSPHDFRQFDLGNGVDSRAIGKSIKQEKQMHVDEKPMEFDHAADSQSQDVYRSPQLSHDSWKFASSGTVSQTGILSGTTKTSYVDNGDTAHAAHVSLQSEFSCNKTSVNQYEQQQEMQAIRLSLLPTQESIDEEVVDETPPSLANGRNIGHTVAQDIPIGNTLSGTYRISPTVQLSMANNEEKEGSFASADEKSIKLFSQISRHQNTSTNRMYGTGVYALNPGIRTRKPVRMKVKEKEEKGSNMLVLETGQITAPTYINSDAIVNETPQMTVNTSYHASENLFPYNAPCTELYSNDSQEKVAESEDESAYMGKNRTPKLSVQRTGEEIMRTMTGLATQALPESCNQLESESESESYAGVNGGPPPAIQNSTLSKNEDNVRGTSARKEEISCSICGKIEPPPNCQGWVECSFCRKWVHDDCDGIKDIDQYNNKKYQCRDCRISDRKGKKRSGKEGMKRKKKRRNTTSISMKDGCICAHCEVTSTSLWRKHPEMRDVKLCNACYAYIRSHGSLASRPGNLNE